MSASRPTGKALMLVGTLAAALALVALAEGTLRLAGVGDLPPERSSRLRYQQVWLPMLTPSERPDGTPVLATTDGRVPWQSILREKPRDGLRVFCVGGSATAGLGYSANVTYARQLERLLRAAFPALEVEVVNLGIVALSSREVLGIVGDVCRGYDPDLVVVYSGNNEFLEIHAEKYAERHRSALASLTGWIGRTHVMRALQGVVGGTSRRAASTATVADMARAEFRVAETELLEQVRLTDAEKRERIDAYERNLQAMADVADEAGVPLLLMSVASNWEWRGREDLPEGWIEELTGGSGDPRAALEALATDTSLAEHERLVRRAAAHELLGEHDRARELYRASMNADPHLRRALDELGRRVAAVADRTDAAFLDTVAFLSAKAEHGIVGFGEFYDYVHFTPRGTVLVASELFRRIGELGLLPEGAAVEPDAWADAELARLDALESDPVDVGLWMGLGEDLGRVHDRDLWKHQAAMAGIDAHLGQHPDDWRALAWRGNAGFFLLGGFEAAERDYRAALERAPEAEAGIVRANLERLTTDRRP